MTIDLRGEIALITGAARGQGAAEAELFVSLGARVVLADVLVEPGRAVAAGLGDAATFVELDVRDPAAWDRALAHAIDVFGAPSVLVNNAGALGGAGGLASTTPEEYLDTMSVNELGCFLGMRAVAPHMTAAGRGAIVNVSSIGGTTGVRGHIAYGASKWAIRGLSKSAAVELGPLGIRVNTVLPGPIDTDMLGGEHGALGPPAARTRRVARRGGERRRVPRLRGRGLLHGHRGDRRRRPHDVVTSAVRRPTGPPTASASMRPAMSAVPRCLAPGASTPPS